VSTSPVTSSPVYELADQYVERFAALDPLAATGEGIGGHDHEMTDYSPDGAAERAEHDRATLRALATIELATDALSQEERIAAEVMRERLELALVEHDAGERLRDLRVLGSSVQTVRMAFDLMARDTADEWQTVAERLALVPQGLSSIEAALAEGAAQGIVAARRQAVACTKQADTWGGQDPGTRPFFLTLVDEYDASGPQRQAGDRAFRDRLEQLATRATAAYAALGRFLVEEYAPHAAERDPVGRERYAMYSQDFNGIALDLDETYAWGWDELHRIEHKVTRAGQAISLTAKEFSLLEYLLLHRGECVSRGQLLAEVWQMNGETGTNIVDVYVNYLRRHRRRRRVPPLEPGPAGSHRRRAERRALRHPRAGATGRGNDRAPGRCGGDVLHGPGRGLQPARTHLVPDPRQDPVPALGRGVDLLPRGRARSSPADRAGPVSGRLPEPLPAHPRRHVRSCGRVGVVRRAAHG